MATVVTFNGSSFSVPAYGDTGWAQGTGNLSSYLIAIAAGCLQTTGGTFTLSADVNFGATFGLKAAYYATRAASPATSGLVRLALADTICWGVANNALGVSGTNLQWNASNIITTASLITTIVEKREVYTAGTSLNNYTGSLTLVNLVGSYLANGVNMNVYVNGLLNDVTLDYTETSTTSFTFGSPLNIGDRISLRWVTY